MYSYDVHISESSAHAGVGKTPRVTTIPRRQGDHDVQPELDAATRTMQQGASTRNLRGQGDVRYAPRVRAGQG